MRIHVNYLLRGETALGIRGAFKDHDGAMSTDWSKYGTPNATRHGSKTKPASEYAVVRMKVRDVLNIPGQEVIHTPDRVNKNRAHTDVTGDKVSSEIRGLFLGICEFVIHQTDL